MELEYLGSVRLLELAVVRRLVGCCSADGATPAAEAPRLVERGEASAGVGTRPVTETDRGATMTIVALCVTTMHGRTTSLSDAPVSASCNIKTSPTAITALSNLRANQREVAGTRQRGHLRRHGG
jgi:hypothetical protein